MQTSQSTLNVHKNVVIVSGGTGKKPGLRQDQLRARESK